MTVFIIAGHGKARNGGFDPGATGFITKGEHKYMKENLFPAMKKYVGNADIVFFSDYDVFEHGNIVELARKYGKDTTVIECHFDALGPDASGGHVIVKAAYAPDKLDLRLRDAIKSMVGVRYNHKGEQGISGRDNLANVNRTAQAGINYRLIELGFGTNKKDADILMNKTDEYAKKIVEAILNKTTEKQPVADNHKETATVTKDKRSTKFKTGDKVRLSSSAKKAATGKVFNLGDFKSDYSVDWLNVTGTITIKSTNGKWSLAVYEWDIEKIPTNDLQQGNVITLRDKATNWVGGVKISDAAKKKQWSIRKREGNVLTVDNGGQRRELYDWDAIKVK